MVKSRKRAKAVEGESGGDERRKFTRRPLHRVVSFACREKTGANLWYLGWIQDASVAGMKISVPQAGTVRVGESITILCLPGGEQNSWNREPVQIQAEVVWRSGDGLRFGVRFC